MNKGNGNAILKKFFVEKFQESENQTEVVFADA